MISLFSFAYSYVTIQKNTLYPSKLSKEMNIVITHAQIAYKQSVWGITCEDGVVDRIFTSVDDSVRREWRARISHISNPIKDDISICGTVGCTASGSSLCCGRIITTIVTGCILARLF